MARAGAGIGAALGAIGGAIGGAVLGAEYRREDQMKATGVLAVIGAVVGAIVGGGCSTESPGSDNPGLSALPPTRDSCIECVEKHLGAAWVLCAEERDGYTQNRLRAIGHLHEAEDESQAWPTLHDAIREARKRYQQTGQCPNFEALAQLARSPA